MEGSSFSVRVHVPDGELGIDRDPDHAVSRAFRVPMKEGNPQQAMSPVWYAGPDDARFRWLGALVLSAGERVLFFPSWTITADYTINRPGQDFEDRSHVDHLTLRDDWTSFHATSAPTTDPSAKKHSPQADTLPLGNDRYLWFGLAIADAELLPSVKERTIINVDLPQKDIEDRERRRRGIRKATNPHDGPVVTIPDERGDCPYVALVVGPPGFELEAEDIALPLPDQENVLDQLSEHSMYSSIAHPESVVLGDQVEIQFLSMWLPGPLDGDVRIACGRPLLTMEEISE